MLVENFNFFSIDLEGLFSCVSFFFFEKDILAKFLLGEFSVVDLSANPMWIMERERECED